MKLLMSGGVAGILKTVSWFLVPTIGVKPVTATINISPNGMSAISLIIYDGIETIRVS